MIALRSHCEGEDFKTRRIVEAERRIKNEKYENEYNYSFDQYSTALQSAYTILEHYKQKIPDRLKVIKGSLKGSLSPTTVGCWSPSRSAKTCTWTISHPPATTWPQKWPLSSQRGKK
jgi:hypothetical protein